MKDSNDEPFYCGCGCPSTRRCGRCGSYACVEHLELGGARSLFSRQQTSLCLPCAKRTRGINQGIQWAFCVIAIGFFCWLVASFKFPLA